MITNFSIITKNGLSAIVDLGGDIFFERNQPKNIINEIINTYNTGIKWSFNSNSIVKINNSVIKGYPSPDLQFVVAIHIDDGEYLPPNNAILYNADGSFHKRLAVPKMISPAAKQRGWWNKNPDAKLGFSEAMWKKDILGNNQLVMEISEEPYSIFREMRILDAASGEFGECIYSAIEYK